MVKDKQYNYDESFHVNPNLQKRIVQKNNFTYRLILGVLDKYLKSSETVLDIGCGVGTLCLYLASKNKKVTGIDISKNAIKSCKESAEHLGLSKNTQFDVVKFPDQTFKGNYDGIILIEVIEHIKNDMKALEQIYKGLNKGGIAIISTPSANAPLAKFGLLKDFDKRVGHVHRYTELELKEKAKIVGFKVLKTEKREGVVRNFLFTNKGAGHLVRFVRYFVADIVTFVDNISLNLFGESDLFIILKKP
jgi:2-polyprenyl-3-methyl-5-hydroxy-6-metoxy-1,4-benzoquinol methylase